MIGDFEKNPAFKKDMYLIDFGISQKYIDGQGRHIKFKKNVPFKGNLIFSSKNAFGEVTLSRRDDFISLIYFLIFCFDSNIAWFDHTRNLQDQYDDISRYKILTKPKELCKDKSLCLFPLARYVFNLTFKEEPNYDKIKFLLEKVLLDMRYIPGLNFDWCLAPGELYEMELSSHKSISTCSMASEDMNEDGRKNNRVIFRNKL